MSLLRKIADNQDPSSLASKLRRKRFAFFQRLLKELPRPIRILDVGGTEVYWMGMGFDEWDDCEVTLLNVCVQQTATKNVVSMAGDARQMPQFGDSSFDVVYSNSVIEHLGTFEDQQRMADEVQRVGKRYFVQTPNRYFPLEPHFLFPFFQFLPFEMRVWIASHYRVGWACHPGDPVAARKEVESIRLLSRKDFVMLFPNASIYPEQIFGMTKSWIAFGGWPTI